jgi:uncharacterized protein YbgA (DUF1722 family)
MVRAFLYVSPWAGWLLIPYKQSLLPLIAPITLLLHYVRKYDQSYLKKQYYLEPHPL